MLAHQRCVPILLISAILAGLSSAEPVAKITGPTQGEPGNLVILRTEGTVGTGHRWVVLPTSAEAHFLPVIDASGNQSAVFAFAKACEVSFILAVAEDGQVSIAVHTLVQGTPEPPDPPGPDPPGPDPPEPTVATNVAVVIVEDRITAKQSGTVAALRAHCDAAADLGCIVLDVSAANEFGDNVAAKYVTLAGDIPPPFAMGFAGDKMAWVIPLPDTPDTIIAKLK